MVAHPGDVKIHRVQRCQHCDESLTERRVEGYVRRQVFDLPEIKYCRRCGKQTVVGFPAEVGQRTQYGSRIQSFAMYLKNQGLLSYQRTAEVYEDLLGVSISEGTLAAIDRWRAHRLEPVVQQIKERLLKTRVRHYDETSLSINGKLAWLHSASSPQYTYYYPHDRRGFRAAEEIGILGRGVSSISVHDTGSNHLGYAGEHAPGNAHQGREPRFLAEECRQGRAKRLHELLLQGKHRVALANAAGRTRLSQKFHSRYGGLVGQGLRANPPPRRVTGGPRWGRIKKSKARNLAERDLRMIKVQQKSSGTFRSAIGAMGFCRIRSLISTVKKQGASVITALNHVVNGSDLSLFSCLQKG